MPVPSRCPWLLPLGARVRAKLPQLFIHWQLPSCIRLQRSLKFCAIRVNNSLSALITWPAVTLENPVGASRVICPKVAVPTLHVHCDSSAHIGRRPILDAAGPIAVVSQ